MVLNEASEFDRVNYSGQYYGTKKKENQPAKKKKSKVAP
jgi:hypothetical protein